MSHMALVIAFQEDKEQKRQHLIASSKSTPSVEYEYEYIPEICTRVVLDYEYEYRILHL